MFKRSLGAGLLAAVAVPVVALAAAGGSHTYNAKLTGGAESAKVAGTSASVAVTITGGKVCWKFSSVKIAGPLVAHIHKGAAGVDGPVVVPLGGKFSTSGCITMPAAVTSAIVAKPSGYYVNIHTAKAPAGAARGQL